MAETIDKSRAQKAVEYVSHKVSGLVEKAGRKTVAGVMAGGMALAAAGCNPVYQRESRPNNKIVVLGDSTVQRIEPFLVAALKSHGMDPILVAGVQGTQLEGGTARYAPDGIGLLNEPNVQAAIKEVGDGGKVALMYNNNPLLDHVDGNQFMQAEIDANRKVASINQHAIRILPLIANGQPHFFSEFSFRNWLTLIQSTSPTTGFNTVNMEAALCGGNALDISTPCALLGKDQQSGVHVAGVADDTTYANILATQLAAPFRTTTLSPQNQ